MFQHVCKSQINHCKYFASWRCCETILKTDQILFHMWSSLVVLVEVHDLVLHLLGLVRGKAKLVNVVRGVLLWIIISQLRLDCVWTKNCVCGEGAGQTAGHNIISQLQTQVIPETDRETDLTAEKGAERAKQLLRRKAAKRTKLHLSYSSTNRMRWRVQLIK